MKKYELKKGDRIKVLKRPRYWDSSYGNNSPLKTLTFPIIVTVKKIGEQGFGCENDCGWYTGSDAGFEYELLDSYDEGHFLGFI